MLYRYACILLIDNILPPPINTTLPRRRYGIIALFRDWIFEKGRFVYTFQFSSYTFFNVRFTMYIPYPIYFLNFVTS